MTNTMLITFFLAVALMLPLILLMGYRVFFSRNGRFPNTHVSGSAALRRKGIGCVQSQDREARREVVAEARRERLAHDRQTQSLDEENN
ncbi:MAG: hypothetical protein J5808_03135 [Paludibacteraceae bacterium]|nr:hypothetical protein [Paludibacteraceae bacterium]